MHSRSSVVPSFNGTYSMKKYLVPSFFVIGYIVTILGVGSMVRLESYKTPTNPFDDGFQAVICDFSGYSLAEWMFTNRPVLASFLLVTSVFAWGFVSGSIMRERRVQA